MKIAGLKVAFRQKKKKKKGLGESKLIDGQSRV